MAKRDSNGRYVSGAKLGIWGPDGYYNEVWTEADKTTVLSDLKKGQYTVKELVAPQNMILNLQSSVHQKL